MTEIHPFTTREAWLGKRLADVTSTESAALFGMSPYMTAFELWHRKRSGLVPEFNGSERVAWGNHLEAAIAAGIAEQQGWTVEPMKDYWRRPDERLGSSFDFVITNHASGEPAHLELKNVDFMTFKRDWIKHEDGTIEAAAHIELQVQHQLAVSGFPRAYIGALIGGNKGLVIERERDEQVIAAIRAKVAEFWRTVDAGGHRDAAICRAGQGARRDG
jgi:predicted phage-related endonuclease